MVASAWIFECAGEAGLAYDNSLGERSNMTVQTRMLSRQQVFIYPGFIYNPRGLDG